MLTRIQQRTGEEREEGGGGREKSAQSNSNSLLQSTFSPIDSLEATQVHSGLVGRVLGREEDGILLNPLVHLGREGRGREGGREGGREMKGGIEERKRSEQKVRLM